ncbi:MAG: CYTH domain-containing protein [Candidatus Paceibacterota bacterium]|jgi:adenylate cyclase class 2
MENREIECRFLEIDKEALIQKLRELGAEDKGEVMLEETIVYDKDLNWKKEHKLIKIRKSGDNITLTFKHRESDAIDGTKEIEFGIDNYKKAEQFFDAIGLVPYRKQQKLRHTFILDDVTLDIDTWPRIPTYVEFEAMSEEAIKKAVEKVGLDWGNHITSPPATVIESVYNIPVRQMRHFTFDRFE